MNTFEFARYLISSLDADVALLKAHGTNFRGAVRSRIFTLHAAIQWVKFPQSLKLEATKSVRRAKTVLNEQ